jgi:hypothetical protein
MWKSSYGRNVDKENTFKLSTLVVLEVATQKHNSILLWNSHIKILMSLFDRVYVKKISNMGNLSMNNLTH